MPSTSNFAEFYDAITDPEYRILDFIETYFKRKKISAKTILELGCGTGKFSFVLSGKGLEVTAIDLNAKMVELARQKAAKKGIPIEFKKMDMRNFAFSKKFGIVLCRDAMNWVGTENDLLKTFKCAFAALEKGGAFVFDFNTMHDYDSRNLWAGYGGHINEDVSFVWKDSSSGNGTTCDIDIAFFKKQKNGLYKMEREILVEKSLPLKTVKALLGRAGFSKIEILSQKMKKASEKDLRVYFAARK